MFGRQRIGVVIPALNEGRAIARVIASVPAFVDRIVVVDNGSTDDTASEVVRAGADVIVERQRGYGAACLAGVAALDNIDIIVFLDGDLSDDATEMASLVAPIANGPADMVIGSRVRGQRERGALTPQQRFGNWLACCLMRRLWGVSWSDLGPFRAIRSDALHALAMRDRGYGWTVEMQIKAAVRGLNVLEVPVRYRRRVGISKISGTLMGSLRAGTTILSVIARSSMAERKP